MNIKEKFLAQYFEFYKTLKSNSWNKDGYTNKNSVKWKLFGAIREELIQFSNKIRPYSK